MTMISKAIVDNFRESIPLFEEKIREFDNQELDRNKFKGISGGYGCYAQKENGYMIRLRLAGGRVSKEQLKFIVDKCEKHEADLLKITTCQTVQVHNLSSEAVVDIMYDATDVGIVTKGGGGDNPRNTMASALSGVEQGELFDVSPYVIATGEYLLEKMPQLHMPRKLKVGFSNSPENEPHATFRDLGFVAREDGTFSVYCAGGLGPNPKLGVHIADHVDPKEVLWYVSAMIRLFTTYGNYDSRAKARTRYMQDTLGEELKDKFLGFLEEARKEEKAWDRDNLLEENALWQESVEKKAEATADQELKAPRVIAQKQKGLYSVAYHPIGGRLQPKKLKEIYESIKDIACCEIRLSPDGTLYVINLSAEEAKDILKLTEDGARNTFETSVSCIASPICQHGLRNSYALLTACVERTRKENFADGVLPKVHISGCPSSCGSHQVGAIGFVGHSKKVDGKMQSAFKVFSDGCETENGTTIGTEKGVILESVIPEFLVAVGKCVAEAGETFEAWYPKHKEDFTALVTEYAEKE